MKVELNIGLRVQGQDLHPDCASQIMRNIALTFKPRMMLANVQEAKSGEPTLVVMLVTNAVGLTTKVEELADQWCQDCIAAKFQDERDGTPAVGYLLGHNTEPYGGAFNADYWLDLDYSKTMTT